MFTHTLAYKLTRGRVIAGRKMRSGDRKTIDGRHGPTTANRFPRGAVHYDVRGGAWVAVNARYGEKVWRPHSQTIHRHNDNCMCNVM